MKFPYASLRNNLMLLKLEHDFFSLPGIVDHDNP